MNEKLKIAHHQMQSLGYITEQTRKQLLDAGVTAVQIEQYINLRQENQQ